MTLSSLKIGDLIVRAKGIVTTHYLVYLGKRLGVHMVAENQRGHGVRIVTLDEALNGNSIIRFEPFGGQEHERNMVHERVNSLLGKAYDLIAFNCEHFARLIAEGKLESKQVKKASDVAITGGLGLLALGASKKNKALMWVGGLATLAGVLGHFSQRNNQ